MKEPTTEEEIAALQEILRSNPQRYLQITNSWIGQDPTARLRISTAISLGCT